MILSCPLGSSSHAGWPCLLSLGPHSHPKQILFPDPRQRACVALPDSLLVDLLELRPVPFVKLPALTPPLVLLDAASFPSSRHFAVCQCGSPGSPICIANFLPISALLPPSSFPPTLVPFHPHTAQQNSAPLFPRQLHLALFPAFFAVPIAGSAGISTPLLNLFLSSSLSLSLSSLRQHSSEQPSTGIFEATLTIRSKPVSIAASVPN